MNRRSFGKLISSILALLVFPFTAKAISPVKQEKFQSRLPAFMFFGDGNKLQQPEMIDAVVRRISPRFPGCRCSAAFNAHQFSVLHIFLDRCFGGQWQSASFCVDAYQPVHDAEDFLQNVDLSCPRYVQFENYSGVEKLAIS